MMVLYVEMHTAKMCFIACIVSSSPTSLEQRGEEWGENQMLETEYQLLNKAAVNMQELSEFILALNCVINIFSHTLMHGK